MITAFAFLLLLSVLIFVHELGHFLAARKVGIKVEEFAFGLPFTKPILSKTVKGLKLSIYPILFGGFVKLYGEEDEEKIKQTKKSDLNKAFFAKSKIQRIFVILAGVFMNFLLSVVVISYIFTQGVPVPSKNISLTYIAKNSPAYIAGLKIGDIVLSINKKPIDSPEKLIAITKENLGKTVVLEIKRDSRIFPVTLTPRTKFPKDQGAMGVAISNLETKKFTWYQAPFYGLLEALGMSFLIIKEFLMMIYRIVTVSQIPKDIAGPIGIAQLTGQAVKYGYIAFLQLLGLISLNLAVVNALPIPALDGGKLVFVLLEDVFGKKLRPKVERIFTNISMALLLTLILVITLNDLNRIFDFGAIFAKIIETIR